MNDQIDKYMKQYQNMQEEQQLPIPRYAFRCQICSLILIVIRCLILAVILCPLLLCQHYLVPLIVFPIPRRYISCVMNLIGCRMMLLVLGILQFQSHNFKFFSRDEMKFTLKSGYIGIAFHKNIIDFMYYSYLLTPIFTRIIIHIKSPTERQILYAPLTYLDAWKAAYSYRGFEPLIVRSNQEFRRLKVRKMTMNKLVSESFDETAGPILILLPGISNNQNLEIDPIITDDIYSNDVMHRRSGVGLNIEYHPTSLFNKIYMNQSGMILRLMETLTVNKLTISALTFGKYRSSYFNKQQFKQFVHNSFLSKSKKYRNILYEDYVQEMTQKEKIAQQSDDSRVQIAQINKNPTYKQSENINIQKKLHEPKKDE